MCEELALKRKETKRRCHISYDVFQRVNDKSANMTIKDLFLNQLVCIRTVGPEKAIAITNLYPTPHRCEKKKKKKEKEKETTKMVKLHTLFG